MICPTCSTHIPDGCVRCPACHANVSYTVRMPQLMGRWCPSCGGALGWQDEVCPSCGLPVEAAWGAPVPERQEAVVASGAPEPEPEVDENEDTRAMARIESAIPAEHDPESKVEVQEVMPRTRGFALAAVASLLLVCGVALVISHPWNPDAYSIKATTEADTSMAGFPGTVETLTGQDSAGQPRIEVIDGDDATFAELSEEYERLARLAQRTDDNELLFSEVAFGSDLTARTQGKRDAEALAIDVSNLIERLGRLDVTSGTYVSDVEHLTQLGNWLRNRVDTLVDAWKADIEATDPAAAEQELRATLTRDYQDDQSTYKTLFDENYEAWQPVKAE